MNPFAYIGTRIDHVVLPHVSRHALDVLKREYDAVSAHQILWHAWDAFGPIVARVPVRRPPGTRIMLSLAAASAALHCAMMRSGAEESHATAVVAEIGRRCYRNLSRIPWWLGRLLTLDSIARLSVASRLSHLFGLVGPAYSLRTVSPSDGSLTLEIHRCSGLQLYRELGIAHLARPLVCDVESAIADEWQATMTRTHALSEGHAVCRHQIRSIAPQHGGRHAGQPLY